MSPWSQIGRKRWRKRGQRWGGEGQERQRRGGGLGFGKMGAGRKGKGWVPMQKKY